MDIANNMLEQSVRHFWLHGSYSARYQNFREIYNFEENYAVDYIEKIAHGQEAYNTMHIHCRDQRVDYSCARLPFSIDCSNMARRDLPYFSARVILRALPPITIFQQYETSAAKSVLTLHMVDLVTLDRLYFAYRESNIKIKCGRNGFRRVYRYQDIILAHIFKRIGQYHESEINFNELVMLPKPYCRGCTMRLFERLGASSHCELCSFSKASRFSTKIFELNGHFNDCRGDDPHYPQNRIVRSFMTSHEDELMENRRIREIEQ